MSAIRRVPAALLVIVLALLPVQAWLTALRPNVTINRPLDGLDGITWAGTVGPDGDLAVSITYDFDDDLDHAVDVRLPTRARFVTVNGEPQSSSIGRYVDEVTARGAVTVTYERRGIVTRYDDGVVVDLSGLVVDDDGLFPCARCYTDLEGYGHAPLYWALFAPGAGDGRMAASGLGAWQTGADPDALRFVGELIGAEDSSVVALLPADSAPDLAVSAGSAKDVYDSIRDSLREANEKTKEPGRDLPVGRAVGALILTAMVVGLVVWIAWRLRRAAALAGTDDPSIDGVPPVPRDAAFSPPSGLEPVMVGAVVGDAGPGERSAVGGTLLNLAHRGVIRIDGIDSQRYTLTVPPGARGETKFEEAVLNELRPQGSVAATATLTGPPLWGPEAPAINRKLGRLALREAMRQGLVRLTLGLTVLVPASLAIGITALIVSGGRSRLALFVTFAGPLIAVFAALLTGLSLTRRGRAERDQWLEYAQWLRNNSELHQVGAPAVAVWGDVLAYATVVGAAPTAAKALSPRT